MKLDVDMAMTYLDFVCERHKIWGHRQSGHEQPWTKDPILATKKFTNVYRVLDAGSQFLVKMMHADADQTTPEDVLLRAFIYRYTNRPEPYQAFHEEFGRYPLRTDLERNLPDLWRDYHAAGNPIFGSAYKMFVGQENRGLDRLSWVLGLTAASFGGGPADITEDFLVAGSPEERIFALRKAPRCAGFMSMQILTDWGYWSPTHDENAYVVPGPGAVVGARAIGMEAQSAITWARSALLWRDDQPVLFTGKGLRAPSLMDIQNTFCEFGKYARYLTKPLPPKQYRPAHPGPQPAPFLPPHWQGEKS